MMRFGLNLFPILLITGCGDADRSRESGKALEPAAGGQKSAPLDAERAAQKPLTSVMRPSVAAEVEPPNRLQRFDLRAR